MMIEYIHIINLVFLSFGTYFDCFKDRKINDSLFLMWIIGIIFAVSFGIDNIILRSVIAGTVFIMMFMYSRKKQLGMADVFALGIIAFSLPPIPFALWITFSYMLMGIMAVSNAMHQIAEENLLLNRTTLMEKLRQPYPFFPFMLGAYIIVLLL